MSEQIGLNAEPLMLWERFERNKAGRDFAVGDIHGHFPTLERLLARVEFDETRDRVFAVGDLIDRGPASVRFRDYLDRPWFHAVRGNHEQMMIESASDPEMLATWEDNGGGWATRCMSPTAIDRLREVADRLPVAIEAVTRRGLVGLVHAHLPFPTWSAFRQALEAMSAAPSDPQRVQGSSRVSPYSSMGDTPWLWEALYSRATAREMFNRKWYGSDACEALRIPDLHALGCHPHRSQTFTCSIPALAIPKRAPRSRC